MTKIYYQSHLTECRDRMKVTNHKTRSNNRNYLNTLKSEPCTDCHSRYNPWQMDFDHKDPTKKIYGIARMLLARREDLDREIAKCDLVCANCHRNRTYIQYTR